MNAIISRLLESTGFKRLLASLLAVLYGVASVIPQVQPLVSVLEQLAAAIGGVGVVHAATAKTLTKAKLASASSILSILLVLCNYIPALAPYKELIEKLAELFGATAVGASIVQATPAAQA